MYNFTQYHNFLVVILLIICSNNQAVAQKFDINKLSVSFGYGSVVNALDNDTYEYFDKNGFGDNDLVVDGLCFAVCSYRTSYYPKNIEPFSWVATARYELDTNKSVEVAIRNTSLGGAQGYDETSDQRWSTRHRLISFAPSYLIGIKDYINIGSGISFNRINISHANDFKDAKEEYAFRLGLILNASVRLPLNSSFFLQAKYDLNLLSPYEMEKIGISGINLGSADFNYSYNSFQISLGYRF